MQQRASRLRGGLVAAACVLAASGAWASQELVVKGNCQACHLADKKLLGPSWKEIATRYKGQAAAPAQLAERVRKGGSGQWGAVPMPATEKSRLSDAELKALVAWVLKTS